MEINEFIDVVILGAGPPSIGKTPSPLKQLSIRNSVIEWQLDCFSVIENLRNIYFVGGYQVDEIRKKFPTLKIINNKNWQNESILDSFLKIPKTDSNLIVTYSDTLFRKEYFKKLSGSNEDVTITIDSLWKNRYSNRSEQDIKIAEKIRLPNRSKFNEVEFTGLLKLNKESVNKILSSKGNLKGKKLVDLIDFFKFNKISHDYFDVKGDWSELNAQNDLVKFVLGTKAESLIRLQPMVKKSKIGKSFFFNINQWEQEKKLILKNIQKDFKNKKIVIRSSSSYEDSFQQSSAGKFKSFINIDSDDSKLIKKNVDLVIKSYPKINETRDKILIQEFIENVKFSGVIFTCDLVTGAPYYKLNYDFSGKTDLITSGKSTSDKNLVVNKAQFNKKNTPKEIFPILDSVQEIESLLIYDKLDIEFAVDKNDVIHIFQVRPITVDHSSYEYNLEIFNENIKKSIEKYNLFNKKFRKKYNRDLIYSNMPDWNPAEIIGTKPYPLAFSLYEEVITNEIWSLQRDQFGYKSLNNKPLLISFAGQPFVDCGLSFESFIPKDLNQETSKKLLKTYITILSENKELFDKIEFEIALTCWVPDFFNYAKERLSKFDFSENEISDIEKNIKKITSSAIKNFSNFISPIDNLENLISDAKNSKTNELSKVKKLINDCKINGTLPFAHAARNGFISTILLKSFVDQKIISQERYDDFFESVRTITSEFEYDLIETKSSKQMKNIISKYGHLRPGTYEITSDPYWKNPDKYLTTSLKAEKTEKKFTFTEKEKAGISKIINNLDKSINFNDFKKYLITSIQERERVKFEFTKSISLSLDLIENWGKKVNIGINDIKYLKYENLIKFIDHGDLNEIRKVIKQNKENFIYTQIINLPDIIENEGDFHFFEINNAQPNFISNKKTISNSIYDLKNTSNLSNKIILIENADPGYDWLFNKGISGIITKYGGANSHMAIRSAEIGIPAAIGVGKILFDKLKSYNIIELDCLNKILREA